MSDSLNIPVTSRVDITKWTQAITADSASNGHALTSTPSTSKVELYNWAASDHALEYSVNSGAWLKIEPKKVATLLVNLAVDAVRVRRSARAVSSMTLEVWAYSVPGNFEADADQSNNGSSDLQFPVPVAGRAAVLQRLKRAAVASAVMNAETGPLTSDPPTFTANASATGGWTVRNFFDNQGLFSSVGADLYYGTSTSFARGFTMDTAPGTGNVGPFFTQTERSGWDARTYWVSFVTNAADLEIRVGRPSSVAKPYKMMIDGQYVDRTGFDMGTSGGNGYMKLNFASGRRTRRISIQCWSNQHSVMAVNMAATDSFCAAGVSAYGGAEIVRGAFTGDSFTVGQNAASVDNVYPYIFGRLVGVNDVRNYGIGGTGYYAGVGASSTDILGQIALWPRVDLDLIHFAAGYNDSGQAALAAKAMACWAAARARCPSALIVVQGPHGGRSGPSAQKLADEAVLLTAFNTWADPFSMWLPVNNTASPWQQGTGYVGATTGTGNNDRWTSNDGTHPSDEGQSGIAYRLAYAYREKLALLS